MNEAAHTTPGTKGAPYVTDAMRERMRIDPSGAKPSYWLRRAAASLDCAVQCCGTEESTEIDAMESRCDELAARLREQGR